MSLIASAVCTLWERQLFALCTVRGEHPLSVRLRGGVCAIAFKVVAVSVPQRQGSPQSGARLAADCKTSTAEHSLKHYAQIINVNVMAQYAMDVVHAHRNVQHKCDINKSRIVFCGEELESFEPMWTRQISVHTLFAAVPRLCVPVLLLEQCESQNEAKQHIRDADMH